MSFGERVLGSASVSTNCEIIRDAENGGTDVIHPFRGSHFIKTLMDRIEMDILKCQRKYIKIITGNSGNQLGSKI